MAEETREQELKKNIRRLTKRIGNAKKSHDHGEVDKLRAQRGGFIKSLAEEFDTFYIIRDGKSDFVSQEEAVEFYEDPEEQKKVAAADAETDLFKGRRKIISRRKLLAEKSDEDVKKQVLDELDKEEKRLEGFINEIRKQVDLEEIDFSTIEDDDDDWAEGIDLDSVV